eukprot:COSAG05_NODE_1869_length_3926_cov_16.772145_1_plen_50_part_00
MRSVLVALLGCATVSAEPHPEHLTLDNHKSLACDECQVIAYQVCTAPTV